MDRRTLFTLAGGALTGMAVVPIIQNAVAAPDGTGLKRSLFETRGERLRDRAAFARHLRRVKVGMRQDEVRKLLGGPDDVWSGEEMNARRDGFVFRKGRDAWTYGGDGHLAFPRSGELVLTGAAGWSRH